MEAQMPFFLLKDFSNQIEKQINFEEKQTIYDYVRFMISPEFIDSVLKENNMVSDDLASDLYSRILKNFVLIVILVMMLILFWIFPEMRLV